MKISFKAIFFAILFLIGCQKEPTEINTNPPSPIDTTNTVSPIDSMSTINPIDTTNSIDSTNTTTVVSTNPYQVYEGMYIGIFTPYLPIPAYTDTVYLETLNVDSFMILSLDQDTIKLEIDPSSIYNLGCNWTHCNRMVQIVAPDTMKYDYAYSWGTPNGGGGYRHEYFVGIKQ